MGVSTTSMQHPPITTQSVPYIILRIPQYKDNNKTPSQTVLGVDRSAGQSVTGRTTPNYLRRVVQELADNTNHILQNKVTSCLAYLKYIFLGNLMAIKKIEDVSQKMDCLQKAQAHTRGQIEGLRTEEKGG